jgi:hypothetical protein
MTEAGRVDTGGLCNLSAGISAVGSLYFDLPKEKSLLKNPRFSAFRYANNGLEIIVAARVILTGVGCILTFNNDEGGVCPNKPGILEVEAEADGRPGPYCEGPLFHAFRPKLL